MMTICYTAIIEDCSALTFFATDIGSMLLDTLFKALYDLGYRADACTGYYWILFDIVCIIL